MTITAAFALALGVATDADALFLAARQARSISAAVSGARCRRASRTCARGRPCRCASRCVLHVYAMLWAIGIVATARTRPHRFDAARVRLRFGCLRRLDLDRANIETARVHGPVASEVKRALRRADDTVTMTLDGAPAVELTLREPVAVRSMTGRTRTVRRVFVAADEPAAFVAARAA